MHDCILLKASAAQFTYEVRQVRLDLVQRSGMLSRWLSWDWSVCMVFRQDKYRLKK